MNSADGADEHPEHVPQAAFDVPTGGQLLAVAFDRRDAVHKGRRGHGDRDGDARFADHRGDPGVGRGAEVHEETQARNWDKFLGRRWPRTPGISQASQVPEVDVT